MKVSQFIVEQRGLTSGTHLLYSTLTTSLVELEDALYEDIFVLEKYDIHPEEVESLQEMGFLISDNIDELAFLHQLRIQTIEVNHSSPTYYIICPTTGCNAQCYYCFEKGAVQKRMDQETAVAVANYIVKNSDPEHLVIQWFGGEPLLEPSIISYIANQLHENNINFESKIITNGYLINENIIQEAIKNWNVTTIQITIDGLHDEYNSIKNYIYYIGDPFETVMSNIEKCLSSGINVRIRINFSPLEHEKVHQTVAYLRNRFEHFSNFFVYLAPIDSTDIPSISSQFETNNKHPLIALLDAEGSSCSFGNYQNKAAGMDKHEEILQKYYLTPIPTSCYGGCESSLTIDSFGNIFTCHRLLGHEKYASGNVISGREKNEIQQYYENPNITDERCNTCNLLPLCQGGCKYRAFAYGKDHACTFVKGAVKELIRRAAQEIYEL